MDSSFPLWFGFSIFVQMFYQSFSGLVVSLPKTVYLFKAWVLKLPPSHWTSGIVVHRRKIGHKLNVKITFNEVSISKGCASTLGMLTFLCIVTIHFLPCCPMQFQKHDFWGVDYQRKNLHGILSRNSVVSGAMKDLNVERFNQGSQIKRYLSNILLWVFLCSIKRTYWVGYTDDRYFTSLLALPNFKVSISVGK